MPLTVNPEILDRCLLEEGSFRDRNGRVFYFENSVYRALSQQALAEWNALQRTTFFPRFVAEGKLVRTEQVEASSFALSAMNNRWSAILKHESIPFISYPYEWCFGMLKDAALLQIELLLSALEEDFILKDASAFNVQWKGSMPVFIDILSFEKHQSGEPWAGYRQFCQMFLYPLMLQAYKNVSFQSWLRGSIDGMSSPSCRQLMSLRDLLRPGVLTHVYLQSLFESKFAKTHKDVKVNLRSAGFNKELIKANARRLLKLVKGLSWAVPKSVWTDYSNNNSYNSEDQKLKMEFVHEAVQSQRWNLVWDLGCNTGVFSRIAAENAEYVVSMDADQAVVERFYQELKQETRKTILPLLMNLADPSPGLGWRGMERKSLLDRGRPELTLCLALIHHMVISANIPLREFVSWLGSLGGSLVIEFITKEDPMVKTLLLNKKDNYEDYEVGNFEKCLAEFFHIVRRLELMSGTRILYFAKNKYPSYR